MNHADAAVIAAAAANAARRSKARTISIAAREAGVHVETIRYYERMGLIPRPAAGSAYRHYPESTIERIRFIKHAQEFGFTLKETAELLGLSDDATCEEVCGRIELKVQELDGKIGRLTHLRDHLAKHLAASPRKGLADSCKVMECLRGDCQSS